MVNQEKQLLEVYLHEKRAGTLSYDGSIYEFAYDQSYLSSDNPLPLSLSLPLQAAPQRGAFGGKNIPLYFHHLLPEGWLLNLAKSLKMPTSDPMSLLSLLVVDTVGAIKIYQKGHDKVHRMTRIVGENEPLYSKSSSEESAPSLNWHQNCLYCGNLLVTAGHNNNFHPQCANLLFGSENTPRFEIDRDRIRDIAAEQLLHGEGLTGVQEKFSLRHRKDRKTIASPLSCFIAKPQPQSSDLQELAKLEGAYMLFARMLELPVARTGLIYLADGTECFISRRFDITATGNKIHQEDLAAPLGKLNKYESSHEGIARILISNSSVTEKESHFDRLNFLKITLFNFLLGNTDALEFPGFRRVFS